MNLDDLSIGDEVIVAIPDPTWSPGWRGKDAPLVHRRAGVAALLAPDEVRVLLPTRVQAEQVSSYDWLHGNVHYVTGSKPLVVTADQIVRTGAEQDAIDAYRAERSAAFFGDGVPHMHERRGGCPYPGVCSSESAAAA